MHILKSKPLILVGLYALSDSTELMLSFMPTINGSYSDCFFSIRINSIRWFKYLVSSR